MSDDTLKEIHRLTWHMLDDSTHDVSANVVTIDLAISGEYYNALMEIIGDECPRTMTDSAEGPTPELRPDDQGFRYVLMWVDHLLASKEKTADASFLTEWRGFVADCQTALAAERARADANTKELEDWNGLWQSLTLPEGFGAPALWPNDWHQDCAQVAFVIKGLREQIGTAERQLAEREAEIVALKAAMSGDAP